MAQCSKCGNQDLEFKEGTGKATGKPWKAWYCPTCKLMHGMNGIPWGDKTKAKPMTPQQAILSPPSNSSNSIEKKLDMILEILHDNFGQKPEYIKDDSTPF